MQLLVIQRILGLLLMLHSITMLPPFLVALFYGEPEWWDFLVTFSGLALLGVGIWLPVRNQRTELRTRDGFVVERRCLR